MNPNTPLDRALKKLLHGRLTIQKIRDLVYNHRGEKWEDAAMREFLDTQIHRLDEDEFRLIVSPDPRFWHHGQTATIRRLGGGWKFNWIDPAFSALQLSIIADEYCTSHDMLDLIAANPPDFRPKKTRLDILEAMQRAYAEQRPDPRHIRHRDRSPRPHARRHPSPREDSVSSSSNSSE